MSCSGPATGGTTDCAVARDVAPRHLRNIEASAVSPAPTNVARFACSARDRRVLQMDEAEKLVLFCGATGASTALGRGFLADFDGDVEQAVNAYFSTHTACRRTPCKAPGHVPSPLGSFTSSPVPRAVSEQQHESAVPAADAVRTDTRRTWPRGSGVGTRLTPLPPPCLFAPGAPVRPGADCDDCRQEARRPEAWGGGQRAVAGGLGGIRQRRRRAPNRNLHRGRQEVRPHARCHRLRPCN